MGFHIGFTMFFPQRQLRSAPLSETAAENVGAMSIHTAARVNNVLITAFNRPPAFFCLVIHLRRHPQRPDIDAIVTALRVSLAHAYYGTPPNMVPFSMALPKSLYKPLPPLDPAAHQVSLVSAGTGVVADTGEREREGRARGGGALIFRYGAVGEGVMSR